jgi:hypothetical protein
MVLLDLGVDPPGIGSARSVLDWLESHSLPDYARRSTEEIDATIEQERDAWD